MQATLFTALVLSAAAFSAQAAGPAHDTGPYAGVAGGRSNFSLPSTTPAAISKDESGALFKVYGGYRLTDNFGLEEGYARLGSFHQSVSLAGVPVRQNGSGRSLYGALTARARLGESFALNGRVGLSSGKVSGTNVLPAGQNLIGAKRSAMIGVGAEYRVSPNFSITADLDHYGKLSKNVKASAIMVGLKVSF